MSATPKHTEHLYQRPTWDCRICENPWPCANAKSDLLAEFAKFPSVLQIYMSAQMHDALHELTAHGEPVPADLYQRFLSWTRKPYLVA
jgi:hypothetical protein